MIWTSKFKFSFRRLHIMLYINIKVEATGHFTYEITVHDDVHVLYLKICQHQLYVNLIVINWAYCRRISKLPLNRSQQISEVKHVFTCANCSSKLASHITHVPALNTKLMLINYLTLSKQKNKLNQKLLWTYYFLLWFIQGNNLYEF